MNGSRATTLKHIVRLTAATILLAASLQARAIPIQLTSAQFAADLAGASSVVVENFTGLGGASSNPSLAFANGTLTTDSLNNVLVASSSSLFCGAVLDPCLLTADIADLRTIDALPAGTTLWGADLYFIRPTDLIEITVTGGSGVLSFTTAGSALGGFAGFSDALGITSLTFRDLGTPVGGSGNYAFDNVTTAAAGRVSVPEPATLSLLAAGLLAFAFGGLSRRRSDSVGKPART